MIVTIIGLGLIGGSIALSLKKQGFAKEIIGVEKSKTHREIALSKGLVDKFESLEDGITQCDIVVIATPVDSIGYILLEVLNRVSTQAVTDVGSTKTAILSMVKNHPKRNQYLAAHPMAGTEFSGPLAAKANLFEAKNVVFCNEGETKLEVQEKIYALFKSLGMNPIFINAKDHDMHAAYVSHISHISSMALALTVLEKEKNEKAIFQLASGGFRSTVRLAKSSSDTWIPIFKQNRENVLDVLDEHINTLARFRNLLNKKDYESMYKLIEKANEIGRILKG